jgi:hypothetical protein
MVFMIGKTKAIAKDHLCFSKRVSQNPCIPCHASGNSRTGSVSSSFCGCFETVSQYVAQADLENDVLESKAVL